MTPGKTRWWQRPSRLVPVTIGALVLLAFVGLKVSSQTGLQREMKAVRAKGLPTNSKELHEWYAAVPPEENAGLKFLAAHEVYVEPAKGSDPSELDWRAIPHDQSLDAAVMGVLGEHVAENEETLKRMHEAGKFTKSRYTADLGKAPELLLPHLMQMKRLVSLARWEAVLKAEQGDAAGAVAALRTGFSLARTLAQEPLLISELVRMAYVAILLNGTERVLNVAQLNENQLSELAATVAEAAEECRSSLNRAMIGERAFANTGRKFTFEEYESMMSFGGLAPPKEEIPEPLRRLLYSLRLGLGIQDRDYIYTMRSLAQLIEATELEHPALFSAMENLAGEINSELVKHPILYEMSRMSLGSILYVPKKEVILTARLRSVAMALEIQRWRFRNGGRVPRADELVPGVFEKLPFDPVDGKPLQYETRAHGFRVVAVGATAAEKKGGAVRIAPDVGFVIIK